MMRSVLRVLNVCQTFYLSPFPKLSNKILRKFLLNVHQTGDDGQYNPRACAHSDHPFLCNHHVAATKVTFK